MTSFMNRLVICLSLTLATSSLTGALAAGNPALKINGQAAGSALRVGDQLYIPLSALKAAGVQVSLSSTQVSLTLAGSTQVSGAVGGANPAAAQAGCLNQTLSNGVWSLKFSNLHFVPADPKTSAPPYWALDARVSNLTQTVMDPAFLGGLNATTSPGSARTATPCRATAAWTPPAGRRSPSAVFCRASRSPDPSPSTPTRTSPKTSRPSSWSGSLIPAS